MAVKNNLKEFRSKLHMNQEELASATGSCSRTISRIERGERNPSLEMALRLAECLNTSVEQLFQLDEY
ncbi:MAG: helix-turn-helix transcriptional regulator [Dorea sp.]|nr:helix-turn-helix transcriptional regulator [Dorea sp.]